MEAIARNRAAGFGLKSAFLISLAVFAQEVTWNFYDTQIPVSLGKYITSVGLVGFIMGLDNLLGIFTQPLVGRWSDRLRTRWGRRLPFLMVGMPIAAISFALIPFESSLPALLVFILLYVTAMLIQKTPTDSLLPDFISAEHRSKGNAILKIATSLTVIFGSVLSLLVVDRNLRLAFLIPAALMLVVLPIVLATVKESEAKGYRDALRGDEAASPKSEEGILPTLRAIFRDPDKSRLLLFLTIFFALLAWSALRALLTRYGMENLGMTRGQAGGLNLPGGIAFLLLAYPIALLSERFGRKLLMLSGMGLMFVALLLGFAFQSPTALRVVVVLTSIGYATITINAIVAIWNLAGSPATTGTYTGLYYLFFYAGQSVGPGIVGLMTDVTGWRPFLLNVSLFVAVALVLLSLVRAESAPAPAPTAGRLEPL